MRTQFIRTTTELLTDDPRVALVLGEISVASFAAAAQAAPGRVFNLGIREQLMIGTAGGLALTGLRPIVHSYAPFIVDRVYEQLKLDLDHQSAGAVVASIGASYDAAEEGRTHQSPGDVALLDTLTDWTVHTPGHPAEVEQLLRAAAGRADRTYLRLSSQRNDLPYLGAGLQQIHRGSAAAPVIVAVGPMLHPVLHAITGLDVTVAYTHTPRPFDAAGLRALVGDPATVVLVEPYLAGTSTRLVSEALAEVPHRLLALGVGDRDLRRYGEPADHARWHGLDPAGLRRSLLTLAS
ncbi:transketolase [Natronosporangium hydrolyticum]|uniref:Transketolase n=1 Tax=Natronosporangium hydrolyticum TaxID=2811111 RepID=A0A895YG62_9ACTN|nr:transketolase [Natronosporangium hydrolyticum]QSB14393.1 transketolase [Natronosporangium hydrolyticum]